MVSTLGDILPLHFMTSWPSNVYNYHRGHLSGSCSLGGSRSVCVCVWGGGGGGGGGRMRK